MHDWDIVEENIVGKNIADKNIVVTGGTTGIGRATVEALARRGARVIFTARSAGAGDEVVAGIHATHPDAQVSHRSCHLDDLASVREFADGLRRDLDRLDVLINNAGVSLTERRRTVDGHEYTFGVNHLAHFLLVEELRELLVESAPARIIAVASDAHRLGGPLDFDDLMAERAKFGVVGGMKVYGRSKLANILHTRELARSLDSTGVTANSLHPGFVRTRLARDSEATMLGERLVWPLIGRFARSPEQGASTSIHLACAAAVADVTGAYFADEKVMKPNSNATDDAAAKRLWEASLELMA